MTAPAVTPANKPGPSTRLDGSDYPPIKANPSDKDDGHDSDRVKRVIDRWTPQTGALAAYHRTVEENIRMLSGRQWDVFSELLGAYVDVSQYMTDDEKRWRQRPVVNILQYWFMLTLARLTESPPALTFHPATQDRLDQQLAESLDPVFKTEWAATNMDDIFVRITAWVIAAGEVYLESAVDFSQGEQRELNAPAVLSMPGPDGQPIERATQGPVPYDAQGNPLAALTGDGEGYEVNEGAEAHTDTEGCLSPRVRSPLEVRSEWGAEIAWSDKQWIATESYILPEVIQSQYGVECQADTSGDGTEGFLQRMLFGSGYFGAVSNRAGTTIGDQARHRYVRVWTMWEKPDANSPETDDSPGGRLLIVTKDKVLHDSPRPFRCRCAGPIRRAQYIQQPGRGGFGSTPLEQLVPIQKTYNRGWAQILEHRNLSTNPVLIVDGNSGIADEWSNLPGSKIEADFSQNGQPAYYLSPPPLSGDVWRIQSMLLDIMLRLGSIAGAEGQSPTGDASGELVSQLRYNSDRPVSLAARSLSYLLTGMAEDWVSILPTIWTTEKTISYIGDDQLFKTVTLAPDLWDGNIRVRPDLTNARLETPEVKEQRAMALFTAGVFGVPGTPEAAAKLAQMGQYPQLNKLMDTGGPNADTARQAMSRLAQGQPAMSVQMEEWYDYDTWLKVVTEHGSSPEFLKYTPEIQQEFRNLFTLLQHAKLAQAETQLQQQFPLAAKVAAAQGTVAAVGQAHGPVDPKVQAQQAKDQANPPDDDSSSGTSKD